jgi:hypothetical protein
MIAQECAPALTARATIGGHVLGYRRLLHREPKLEQLVMNARRAPKPIFNLICRISARKSAAIFGRPPRFRDFQRQ